MHLQVSLPSWECGLKYSYRSDYATALYVAPFVGVWWECGLKFKNISIFISVICRSLRGSVDWNHCRNAIYIRFICRSLRGSVDWNYVKPMEALAWHVAPFVGVWIEISRTSSWRSQILSLLSWECGLKFFDKILSCKTTYRRSLCGSVDWNTVTFVIALSAFVSLPLWECGLK